MNGAAANRNGDEIRVGGSLLGEHLLASLAKLTGGVTTTRRLQRNDVVYRPGEPASELFVVQSGRVAIANQAPDGRQALIALVGKGELFGVCSLFDEKRRTTQARAIEASTVVAVPYEPARQVLERHPSLLWGLVELLANRLRLADQVITDSAFLDVTGRTAKRLLELAGDADEFQLPVTQEELAALVGASRERVNKSISTFVRLGWLYQHDRRYRIVDRAQLMRRAGLGVSESA
ncbi:MAG TPA: Crp/Fnr family transcriptional regulator [Acidimicrobiales bacterium]|nr:Crp/Fnr family transcriptional regulator [Acidimicrobiales bacterium]